MRGEIPADDAMWEGTDLSLKEPLAVDLVARSVGEGVLVRGPVRTSVVRDCRRCLEPVRLEVEDTVDLLYEPVEGEEAEELGGEVYPLPDRGDELDLGPALREQLLLRVPAFALCREDCRGLCPQCGTDLNHTTCECTPEEKPSGWDALRQLKFD